jgi:hypothetical protein
MNFPELIVAIIFFVFAPIYDHYYKKYKWIKIFSLIIGALFVVLSIKDIKSPDYFSNHENIKKDTVHISAPITKEDKNQHNWDSINSENTRINQRAYLVIPSISWNGGTNFQYLFSVEIKNTGMTPAYDVRISKIKISLYKLFNNEKELGRIKFDPDQNLTIGNGMSNTVSDTSEIITPPINEINRFCLFFKITYRDVFGRSCFTQVCGWNNAVAGDNSFYPEGKLNKTDYDQQK